MHTSNFGVDNEGNTYLFEFDEVVTTRVLRQLYRVSEEQTLHHRRRPVLGLGVMESMSRIRAILWMVSNETLGTLTCT